MQNLLAGMTLLFLSGKLKTVTVDQDGSFTGTGTDKQGVYTVSGTLVSDDVVL